MKRRLFNIISMLSLILFTAAVGMWVRSCLRADFLRIATEPVPLQITSEDQAAGWDKLRTNYGWAGMFHFRYVGAAFSRGILHLYAGTEGEMVIEKDIPPPRVRFGSDGERFLLIDDIGAMPFLAAAGEDYRWAGFGYFHLALASHSDTHRVSVPLWAICLLTVLLPAWCAKIQISKRRTRPIGCCSTCGYNLTANVSGICPECGTAVPAGNPPSAEC